VPFDYEPDALEPTGWLDFLDELWGDDPESVSLLAEWFGYILSGATRLQKILGIIGPIRSGKGTICRVLKGLIGAGNVTAPTLASFGQNFGLQDMIGKSVAIIGDVRLGGGEQNAVVERLLSISGEDNITLDRKYKDPWTGQLPTRIMFVSNELPRFGDASGAVATRCLVLETRESWLGKEDPDLTAKLLNELPGILNWALDGLTALNKRGRFSEPQSSADITAALADLVSPVSAFVREYCQRGPHEEVNVKTLYQKWKSWAEENGQRAGSAQTFGRNLRSVVPNLRVTRPRTGPDDSQERVYRGVGLKGGAI
jgi:putative DNA primase/helicase